MTKACRLLSSEQKNNGIKLYMQGVQQNETARLFSINRSTTLCLKKNDNDVLRYNFNAHQQILIIFGRDIAE